MSRYWPLDGEQLIAGDVIVKGVRTEQYAHFSVHSYSVHGGGGGGEGDGGDAHKLKRYCYKEWLDNKVVPRGTSDVINFLEFVCKV